jgi:hypothetical protein
VLNLDGRHSGHRSHEVGIEVCGYARDRGANNEATPRHRIVVARQPVADAKCDDVTQRADNVVPRKKSFTHTPARHDFLGCKATGCRVEP